MTSPFNDLLACLHLAQEEAHQLRDGHAHTSGERNLITLTKQTLALLETLVTDQAQHLRPQDTVVGQVDPTSFAQVAALVKVAADADPSLKPIAKDMAEHYQGLATAKRQTRNQAFQRIARAPTSTDGKRTTEAMLEALVAYRESEEGWRDIKEMRVSPMARTANPLLAWLGSPRMSAAVRAEALAHVELYVRSGHAERDLDPHYLPEKAGDREAVTALRILADRLVQGQPVSEEELGRAIEQRFSQVFIQARLRVDPSDGTYGLDLFRPGQPFSLDTLPKAGEVGALIRDAQHPERLWLGCTTSSTDTRWEGDQLPRFVAAVENACRKHDPAVRPVIQNGQTVESHLHQVCFSSGALFPEGVSKQGHGRERLYALAQHPTRDGRTVPWNQDLLHQVRSLGLWRLLDSDTERFGNPTGWLWANHTAIGGRSAWQPGHIGEHSPEALARKMAGQLVHVLHFVRRLTEIPGGPVQWGPHHSDADLVGQICALTQQATRGLYRHFGHHASVAQTLGEARDHMAQIRTFREQHQATKDVEGWTHLLRDLEEQLGPHKPAASLRRRSP